MIYINHCFVLFQVTLLTIFTVFVKSAVYSEFRDLSNEIDGEVNVSDPKAGITVDENDIILRYYNRNFTAGDRIFVNNVTSEYVRGWRGNTPVKILTHGWLSSENSPAVHGIKEAYLEKTNYNVITVDWSESASWKAYPLPAYLTYQVGGIIARLVDKMIEQNLVYPDNVHVIGHSLGSHVAGATGAQVKRGKIGRITGLDPAGPAFEAIHYITKNVLDINDAKFVDVIHTASGAAGYYNELGQADFYPNGGTPIQPGCLEDRTISGVMSSLSCSHGRAYEYYRDSILHPHSFKAYRCDTWEAFMNGSCDGNETTYMGEETPNTVHGVYYLQTKSAPPFGLDNQEDESELISRTLI